LCCRYGRSQLRAPAVLPVAAPVAGFNTWGVTQFDTQLEDATLAAETLASLDNFQHPSAPLFVDFDAVNIDLDEQLKLLGTTDENGQVMGVYSAPWSYFSDDLSASVDCGGTTYAVLDMVKKNSKGEPIAVPDKKVSPTPLNNYAFDPTHPGVLCQAEEYITGCREEGVRLVKIDFINWGSMEGGSGEDGSNWLAGEGIETGQAAYTYGMEKILGWAGQDMVIDLSMAPMFPNHFAHGRRIGCDQM
jgi:hypothetical protein